MSNIKTAESKAIVIGDLMLDEYWHCRSNRISPEAPVPIMIPEKVQYRLGGACNVAVNLGSLGVDTYLLGCLGKDDTGGKIKSLLENNQNITSQINEIDDYISTKKLRIISNSKHVLRVDFEEKLESGFSSSTKLRLDLKKSDVVIISDYNKGFIKDISAFLGECRSTGIFTIVDPKSSTFDKYRNASIITPNLEEFHLVVGECNSQRETDEKAYKLISDLNLQGILLTKSSKGMSLYSNHKRQDLQAKTRDVTDVTGAGDTVVASFVFDFMIHSDLMKAAEFSNYCAGIAVSKFGTSSLSLKDIGSYYEK